MCRSCFSSCAAIRNTVSRAVKKKWRTRRRPWHARLARWLVFQHLLPSRLHLKILGRLLTPEQKGVLISSAAKSADNGPVLVSGMTGAGIEELLRRIDVALPVDPLITLSLRLPLAEGRTLALVHALGRVLSSAVEDSHMLMDAEVPISIARSLHLSQYTAEGTSKLALT